MIDKAKLADILVKKNNMVYASRINDTSSEENQRLVWERDEKNREIRSASPDNLIQFCRYFYVKRCKSALKKYYIDHYEYAEYVSDIRLCKEDIEDAVRHHRRHYNEGEHYNVKCLCFLECSYFNPENDTYFAVIVDPYGKLGTYFDKSITEKVSSMCGKMVVVVIGFTSSTKRFYMDGIHLAKYER